MYCVPSTKNSFTKKRIRRIRQEYMADEKEKARRKKRHCMACCVALGVLVILGALALAFYLRYRPLAPRVVATPVDVSIDEFSLVPPTLKVSVGVHVVVSNPSHAPYRYGAALSAVTYHGEPVGETLVPPGEVGGRSTARIEPATVVDGVKVAENPHFASDAVAGALPFVAVVRVVGKALVLRVFEVPVTVEVVCYVRMYVFHGESSSRCVSSVRTGSGSGSGSGSEGAGAGFPQGPKHEHD
ncbi:uncharacterized protein LOC133893336 [Phragmites australis]|uniref:uncharacterized protein LOC133893336 n=1 Tax=Phragmites australis TaxID=29695 RepID=UPI002D79E82E|nr:uncharacterized protein LOC133893336 [Phragmites australis]